MHHVECAEWDGQLQWGRDRMIAEISFTITLDTTKF